MAEPRSGRGTPRMAETPSGMLNSIGLQGPGIDAFVEKDLAWLKSAGARALVSIAGNSSEEFADVAATLRASDAFDAVVGVEVNISCPNVANRGLVFACDPLASAQVVALVREQLPRDIPIFAKLTPDVTDIVTIAQAVRQGRRRRADHDQHAARHGHRHRPAAPAARRRHRRPVRSGGAAGRRAGDLAGRAPRCSRAGCPRCRSSASGECAPGATPCELVAAGAQRRAGRHRHLQRPERARAGRPTSSRPLLRDRGFARFEDAVGIAHDEAGPAPMTAGEATFGARLRRAMAEHGPLCVGIDPHPGLLAAWGLPDTVPGWRRSR